MKEDKFVLENEKKHKDINVEYKSSSILLNMAMDEYAKERERANALDNKASFFITVMVALVTVFVPIIPFSRLITFFHSAGSCTRQCVSIVLFTGIVVAFVVLLIAFMKLYNAYKLTDYIRPSLDCIDEQDNHLVPNDQLNRGLCDHYKTVVDTNINVNNQKCNSINSGINLFGIGFMVLLSSAIGLIIIVGG